MKAILIRYNESQKENIERLKFRIEEGLNWKYNKKPPEYNFEEMELKNGYGLTIESLDIGLVYFVDGITYSEYMMA